LLIVILLTAGIYVYQIIESYMNREMPSGLPEVSQAPAPDKIEEERFRQEQLEKKKKLAVEAVAVAGEYWIITKSKGRDYAAGQAILRRAKENLKQNNYDAAWELAHQSIKEFKKAPIKDVYYIVRRGDCLWNIAKMPRHYGRGSMWVKIWRANQKIIPDFDLIYSGQKLFIPKKHR
jgi:nucleoid-associated protein YgaU